MAIVVTDASVPATEMQNVVTEPPVSGHHMHKNRLQQYAQRSGIALPSYSTFNEGLPHVPKFRGIVMLDGMMFTSPNTFLHRKEADQDVAKLALEWISTKFKNQGSHYIHKDPVFCKMILNEYVIKFKIDKPIYNTTEQRGILPMFFTSVYFDGKKYVGYPGKNKKEAEQNAACVVIDFILENSKDANAMAQIIKTKGRLYAAVDRGTNVGNDANAGNSTNVTVVESQTTNPQKSVPCTSCVDVAQSSQVNFQIPSFDFPVKVVESQDINSKKRNNQSKKKQDEEQCKRLRVDEGPSASTNPVKGEKED